MGLVRMMASWRGAGAVEVRPVAGYIGAEIHGVDLAGPPADEVVAEIRAALLRWKVVFFREQKLDHAGHVAFARRFGEPITLRSRGSASPMDVPQVETTADRLELAVRHGMSHAEWLERRRHSTLRGWHADHTARIDPPALTVLRAERVPPYDGDTTWANLATAYAGLSEPVRRFADGLRREFLVLTHPTFDADLGGEGQIPAMKFWNENATPPVTARSRTDIATFFEGLELLDPGLVSCSRWRADSGSTAGYRSSGRWP